STPAAATPAQPAQGQAAASELSEGEITRWDPGTLKLTLRHGEIKPLGMPPMTMVFRIPDAGMVGTLKPGDKVLFAVKRINGVFHITRLQAAP
ncbi:MAG: copper-binding protein, partial [Simplicispira sp.]|nr:copper-binding protein [Simplicispira sp.]